MKDLGLIKNLRVRIMRDLEDETCDIDDLLQLIDKYNDMIKDIKNVNVLNSLFEEIDINDYIEKR